AALFPHTQLGLELGSILLIFTGQVWNIAFSFYSSLRSIPRELIEASRINRFSRWQQLVQLELPYSAIGIVWNSMMSVAGGWFFLMVCEMFTVGSQQVMLPGLGSYLQSAASANNSSAIVWGLAAMVGVIILLDQIVWRPVIAWANKFKFEEVESASAPESMVLKLFRRSAVVEFIGQRALVPLGERLTHMFAERPMDELPADNLESKAGKWIGRVISVAVLAGAAYALFEGIKLLSSLQRSDLDMIGNGAIATFLRVAASLLIGSLWTVPVGVMIGFNPKLAKIAQPIVQIAASIPATGYYPVLLRMLLSIGIISASGNLGFAAILLMLLGTQWYILFNVIAGAMAVPTDLKEAASVFRFRSFERWRVLILPAIFPYLITGLVTAAGGAWNASIVAEYITFQNKVFSTTGLGATISAASNNFPLLLGATIVMAAMVVTFNRLVWRRLYRLAETRFKLEA
ncbi:MAG TPA: ABC transporter permease subunit, partial [Blastocatellia bacterium]|nr:ABC transporter permease subunit [Blastocatellia bacterium]